MSLVPKEMLESLALVQVVDRGILEILVLLAGDAPLEPAGWSMRTVRQARRFF